MSITIKAPAKVNWFLEIKGKRDDGYHEIETVMQAIDLFDEITVDESGDLKFTCDIDLGDPAENLVYRAAKLLRNKHAPDRGAHIALKKQIPHGAGLGGGSSDASNALNALNRLWNLDLPTDRLRELAGAIGSDCAFFIEGGTAVCTGRGEIVTPIHDVEGHHVVILYPEEVVSTPNVYGDLSQHLTYEPRNCYLFHVLDHNVKASELASMVSNRLQASALRVSERLPKVWEQTAQEPGALVRFVSGSGSSIAFLMEEATASEQLVNSLHERDLGRAFATRTLPRGAVWG